MKIRTTALILSLPLLTSVGGCQQPEFLFEEMSRTVFRSVLENCVTEEGEWTKSETGDTYSLAGRILFDFGRQLHRPELTLQAWKTVRWYDRVFRDFIEALLAGETFESMDPLPASQAMAGLPILVDGYVHAPGHTLKAYYRERIEAILLAGNAYVLSRPWDALGPEGILTEAIYDPLYLLGTVITVNAEFAMAVKKVRRFYDARARLVLAQTEALINLMDSMFGYRDVDTGTVYYAWRYKSPFGVEAHPRVYLAYNNMPVMGLASYYAATQDPGVYRKTADLVSLLTRRAWQDLGNGRGAYVGGPSPTYIGLAENNTILYAQLLLQEASGGTVPMYLDQAEAFYAYVTEGLDDTPETLGLYQELPEGYKVLLHDNEGYVGRWYWCSGCNLMSVYNVMMLNRLRGTPLPRDFYVPSPDRRPFGK